MPCLKCQGRLVWKERSWTTAGEDPGHWRCIMCGKIVYPKEAGSPKDQQNIPKIIPSANCGGEGGQEIMEETKTCRGCGAIKPIADFNRNVAYPSGRESRCRVCTAQAQRDRKASIKKKAHDDNDRKKRQPRNPGPVRSPNAPSIPSEAVTLDAQLIKAIKRSVANEIIKIITEAFV